MIRYQITAAELEKRVKAHKRGWLKRAAKRTKDFEDARTYHESSGIWSEIKQVYMTIQHNKCAYCEYKLEGGSRGRINVDVEHFRPKSSVKQWPPPAWPAQTQGQTRALTYAFQTDSPPYTGYYLLPYHLLNYVTSCKVCNSWYKLDYFPVHGARAAPSHQIGDYASERPLLMYPLGDVDVNPEEILTFNGPNPMPVTSLARDSYEYRRAQVTIDFFELDIREDLVAERSKKIYDIWTTAEMARLKQAAGDSEATFYQDLLVVLLSERTAHTNCSRAFHRLYASDRAAARKIFAAAVAFLKTYGSDPTR